MTEKYIMSFSPFVNKITEKQRVSEYGDLLFDLSAELSDGHIIFVLDKKSFNYDELSIKIKEYLNGKKEKI